MITNEDMKNMIFIDRMGYHWDNRANDADFEEDDIRESEKEFNRIVDTLDEKDKELVLKFLDDLTNSVVGRNEFYYRKGVEDGVKLNELIQSWKDKQ